MARTDPRPHYGVGRRVTVDGYIDIWAPDHPLARSDGYVREHRMMAWDAKMFTDPTLQVHHKNEIKSDNRLDNFEIKTCPQHSLDHVEERGWVENQYGIWPVKPRGKRVSAARLVRQCEAQDCLNMVPLSSRRDARFCCSNCQIKTWKRDHKTTRRS